MSSIAGAPADRVLRLGKAYGVSKKYYVRYGLTLFFASFLQAFASWERWQIRDRLQKMQLPVSPVFIIGFWRSGTTLLHNLLCLDPEVFYVSTYQSIFPNHFILNGSWLKPVASKMAPKQRPVDQITLSMDLPQEEEIALANLQDDALYHMLYFPNNSEDILQRFLDADPEKWRQAQEYLIKTAQMKQGGSRFISKNPPHMLRIPQILASFEKPCFIYIHREAEKALASTRLFMLQVARAVGFQDFDPEAYEKFWYNLYLKAQRKYLRDKTSIPKKQLFEITYEELVADKPAATHAIYDHFHWNQPDGFDEMLDAYLSGQKRNSGMRVSSQLLSEFLQNHAQEILDFKPKR